MTDDGLKFISSLHQLATQGSFGVGIHDPLPPLVRELILAGYCETFEIANPHQLSGVPRFLVHLTSAARELLDGRLASTGSVSENA